MLIHIDTREQKPLDFSKYIKSGDITATFRQTLNYADYIAIDNGEECPYRFERKSISDLMGTMGKGHDRFKRELEKAKEDGKNIIIIVEGSWFKIIKGITLYRRKKTATGGYIKANKGFISKKFNKSGMPALRALMTLYHKYGIQFVLCKNREEMVDYIIEFYKSYYKNTV